MRRGGRPRRDPASTRTVRLGTRLTPREESLLREHARQLGISASELLRRSALRRPIVARAQPHPVAADQWVELGRLAANLNQLQRAINRGQADGVPLGLVEDLRRLLHEIRRALLAGGTPT
jgi:hypothetical protein